MARQLRPLDIVAPGSLGLNLTQRSNILDPRYCTKALNCVIDTEGRLALRRGHSVDTRTPISGTPKIKALHEYRSSVGNVEPIIAWDGGISNNISDPEGNDISGSVADDDGYWRFHNFNNKCIGTQPGQKMIVYNGTGVFSHIAESSGVPPTGGPSAAVFGRVWQVDMDGVTIKYSGLLDETDWGGTGAGLIDMSAVWTNGMDTVTAIAGFNRALVVFGMRHIVFWEDGIGSALGLNPDSMIVTDVIEGTGCLTSASLQNVGETDLLFLAPSGVQSLKRLTVNRSRPISSLTKYVNDSLVAVATGEVSANPLALSSVYSPEEGFYALSLPNQGITWCIDQRRRYMDAVGEEVSPVTTWDLTPTAMTRKSNGEILMGGEFGVGRYFTNLDDGNTYDFSYLSPWLDLGEELANVLKILKRLGSIVAVSADCDVEISWGQDFERDISTVSRSLTVPPASEWAIAEWGIAEWGGANELRILKVPASGTAQYFRIGVNTTIDDSFAIQQIELFSKLGRLA